MEVHFSPEDRLGSHSGAGTAEMLEVVNLLEKSGITSLIVGTGALRYYGAWRVVDVSRILGSRN